VKVFGAFLAAAMLVAGAVSPPAALCAGGETCRPSCGCAPHPQGGEPVGRSCCCQGSDPAPALPAPPALTPAAPSDGFSAVVPNAAGEFAGEVHEPLEWTRTSPAHAGPPRFLLSCAFLC